jgi:hypothetical protein
MILNLRNNRYDAHKVRKGFVATCGQCYIEWNYLIDCIRLNMYYGFLDGYVVWVNDECDIWEKQDYPLYLLHSVTL